MIIFFYFLFLLNSQMNNGRILGSLMALILFFCTLNCDYSGDVTYTRYINVYWHLIGNKFFFYI